MTDQTKDTAAAGSAANAAAADAAAADAPRTNPYAVIAESSFAAPQEASVVTVTLLNISGTPAPGARA